MLLFKFKHSIDFVRIPGVVGTAGAVEADGDRAGAERFVVPQTDVGWRRRNLHGRSGRGEERRKWKVGSERRRFHVREKRPETRSMECSEQRRMDFSEAQRCIPPFVLVMAV